MRQDDPTLNWFLGAFNASRAKLRLNFTPPNPSTGPKKTARTNPRREDTLSGESDQLLPAALVETVSTAFGFPPRGNPRGARARWNDPTALDPFIAIVSPRPVTAHPHVAGGRTRGHHFLLSSRRSLRDHNGALPTRGGSGRCINDRRLRLHHRRARRRSGDDVRFRFGCTATYKGRDSANGQNRREHSSGAVYMRGRG